MTSALVISAQRQGSAIPLARACEGLQPWVTEISVITLGSLDTSATSDFRSTPILTNARRRGRIINLVSRVLRRLTLRSDRRQLARGCRPGTTAYHLASTATLIVIDRRAGLLAGWRLARAFPLAYVVNGFPAAGNLLRNLRERDLAA